MAEVQPFRLRKVQRNIGIQRNKIRSNFFQTAVYARKSTFNVISRFFFLTVKFCLLKKNTLAFNTRARLFQCCKSRIPLHWFLVHIFCHVCSKLTCWNKSFPFHFPRILKSWLVWYQFQLSYTHADFQDKDGAPYTKNIYTDV